MLWRSFTYRIFHNFCTLLLQRVYITVLWKNRNQIRFSKWNYLKNFMWSNLYRIKMFENFSVNSDDYTCARGDLPPRAKIRHLIPTKMGFSANVALFLLNIGWCFTFLWDAVTFLTNHYLFSELWNYCVSFTKKNAKEYVITTFFCHCKYLWEQFKFDNFIRTNK